MSLNLASAVIDGLFYAAWSIYCVCASDSLVSSKSLKTGRVLR